MAAADTTLLALDWGTSTLRAYRLGPGGAVQERRELPAGIQRLRPGATATPADFERALADVYGDWRAAAPGAPALACGMVGSAQGWREVPYLDLPADLAAPLVRLEAPGGPLWIVPELRSPGELPGVMRGEETQLAGMLADQPAGECVGGVTVAGSPHDRAGLLSTAFSVRTLGLAGGLPAAPAAAGHATERGLWRIAVAAGLVKHDGGLHAR